MKPLTRNQRHAKESYTTIKQTNYGKWEIYFRVGVQSFRVNPIPLTKKEAIWLQRQLAIAIDNLIECNL